MGSNLLQSFLGQALQQIPAIRRSLTDASGVSDLDLGSVRSRLNGISTAARSLDQGEIAEFASAIEIEIESASGIESGLSLLSKLEASLLRSMLEDESFSLDLDDREVAFTQTEEEPISFLFDTSASPEPAAARESEVVFAPEEPVEFEPQTFTSDSADEFEVDPELLDIFAEEAEELLRSIDSSLENLSKDRNDSDSLWEIRRNAITFKGSAGIVGPNQLS